MKLWHVLALVAAIWLLVTGLVLWTAPLSNSSPVCEHRSSKHLADHGGRHSDDRYHVARGELSSCDNPSERSSSDHSDKDTDDDEQKSRFCRKHWYC